MVLKEKINKLAGIEENPSVTISINTHRTHPENEQDRIVLKNAVQNAKDRLLESYDKREVEGIIKKLDKYENEIDINYNLESLHLFLSNNYEAFVRTAHPVINNSVFIEDHFALRPLLKATYKSQEYLILFLSKNETKLFEAMNDGIVEEIKNDDFPFGETPYFAANNEEKSDAKKMDIYVKEHFNNIDKALQKVAKDTNLNCVVVTTQNNYNFLMEVADKPEVYKGHRDADFNNKKPHQLAEQVWPLMQEKMKIEKQQIISQIKESIGTGKVLTELQDIFQAAIDGRGEVLVIHQDFTQPVRMMSERTFEIVDQDQSEDADVVDDITTTIALEVLSKGGELIFTTQDEIKDLGEIVLKTRY